MMKITLEVAKVLIHAAELRARELGIAEVIAIVDDGGNFVASHRMDTMPGWPVSTSPIIRHGRGSR